jgi:hypothetical protein
VIAMGSPNSSRPGSYQLNGESDRRSRSEDDRDDRPSVVAPVRCVTGMVTRGDNRYPTLG